MSFPFLDSETGYFLTSNIAEYNSLNNRPKGGIGRHYQVALSIPYSITERTTVCAAFCFGSDQKVNSEDSDKCTQRLFWGKKTDLKRQRMKIAFSSFLLSQSHPFASVSDMWAVNCFRYQV